MKFEIDKTSFLRALRVCLRAIDGRTQNETLKNVHIEVAGSVAILTCANYEFQISKTINVINGEKGDICMPARKLADLCKTLPDDAELEFSVTDDKATLRSGSGYFTLVTTPGEEFPSVKDAIDTHQFTLPQGELRRLIERTGFAMAQYDVRDYLNGMYWELRSGRLRAVATDGHRLALYTHAGILGGLEDAQVILPRKAVLELAKLLKKSNSKVNIVINEKHIFFGTFEFSLMSHFVDGKYPNYEIITRNENKYKLTCDRTELRAALNRTRITCDKYKIVKLKLLTNQLQIQAVSDDNDFRHREELTVDYLGKKFEIGMNVDYLLSVVNALEKDSVSFYLEDSRTKIYSAEKEAEYVVMPCRL